MLTGLNRMFKGITGAFSLLIEETLGYTNSGGGGSSYYTTTVETTVDAVIGSGQSNYWKSLNKGKDWQTFGADVTFQKIAYLNNKIYVMQQYGTNGNRLASASNFSGFENDWSTVTLPNDNESYTISDLFTYSNNGTTTLACYKSKGDQSVSPYGYELKLWTTTDGTSWSEEIIPTVNAATIISNNGRTFYIESNYENGQTVSKTIRSKFNGTWYSQTVSDYINATGVVFGNNLYVDTYGGSASIIKYGPDCLEISTNLIPFVNEYSQNSALAGYFEDANGQLVIISVITDGSNHYIYKTTNYGQAWTKTATLLTDQAKYVVLAGAPLNYIKSTNTVVITTSGGTSTGGSTAYSEDYGQTWQLGTVNSNFSFYLSPANFSTIPIKTLVETQISIGNQGEEGAEILAPVDVYTVPVGKRAVINKIEVINLSNSSITYDLGKLTSSQTLTEGNSIKWDQALAGSSTDTLSNAIIMNAGDTITVLPSTVNTVDVKVYGIENNL